MQMIKHIFIFLIVIYFSCANSQDIGVNGSVTISGTNNIALSGATVEMHEKSRIPYLDSHSAKKDKPGVLLASTITDASGKYSLTSAKKASGCSVNPTDFFIVVKKTGYQEYSFLLSGSEDGFYSKDIKLTAI